MTLTVLNPATEEPIAEVVQPRIPHLLERGGGSVIDVASFVALRGAATS